jgi:hypothetical protein
MNLSCQHVMKASPNINVHYRNSIRTIPVIRTMLTYVTSAMYSRGYRMKRGYEQRSPYPVPPNIINLSLVFGSISSRLLLEKQCSVRITDGKAKLSQLAEDPYPLTLSSNASLQNIKLIVLESKFITKM